MTPKDTYTQDDLDQNDYPDEGDSLENGNFGAIEIEKLLTQVEVDTSTEDPDASTLALEKDESDEKTERVTSNEILVASTMMAALGDDPVR